MAASKRSQNEVVVYIYAKSGDVLLAYDDDNDYDDNNDDGDNRYTLQ